MISSAEFQQKIRSGQLHEALALVVQETIELEVTTRLTQEPEGARSDDGEYLRTKINLLTGNIQNEVGRQVINSPNFPQLQRLHLEQLVAIQRGVKGYLEQIQAILAILPPNLAANGDDELALPPQRPSVEVSEPLALSLVSSIDPIDHLDEDLDLSLDRDGEVWEEWVEDEDFISRSDMLTPPVVASRLSGSEPPAQWVRKPLDPIAVKPIVPRVAATPVDSATQWEKFEPEYMESSSEKPRVKHYPDSQQLDRILADLDI